MIGLNPERIFNERYLLAAIPTVEQGSELLFRMKLYIDSVIITLLKPLVGTDWAPIVGIAISVNVLTGFVIAIYAVMIGEAVVRAENKLL